MIKAPGANPIEKFCNNCTHSLLQARLLQCNGGNNVQFRNSVAREAYLSGRISTVDFLVLASSDQLVLELKIYFSFTEQATLTKKSMY
jgi:hypothetical protein